MAVINGITVQELRESFSEGIDSGGPRATKAWLVPNWSDRYAVANGLLGLSTLTGGPSGVIGFTHPAAYPESANIWAREISIRGVGTISQGPRQIAWTSAVVTANYGRPQFNFDQSSDPGGYNNLDPSTPFIYASQSLDFGAQVISLGSGTVKLNDGSNTPLNQPYGRTVAVVTMNITLHRMPFLIPITTRNNAGKTNNALFMGCAAGTLRFDGVRTEREFSADGSIAQETSLKFAYRPEAAWDKVLHPNGTSGWTQVRYNGVSVVPSFDFTTIIPAAYQGTG